jgi:hypothetical protein
MTLWESAADTRTSRRQKQLAAEKSRSMRGCFWPLSLFANSSSDVLLHPDVNGFSLAIEIAEDVHQTVSHA